MLYYYTVLYFFLWLGASTEEGRVEREEEADLNAFFITRVMNNLDGRRPFSVVSMRGKRERERERRIKAISGLTQTDREVPLLVWL